MAPAVAFARQSGLLVPERWLTPLGTLVPRRRLCLTGGELVRLDALLPGVEAGAVEATAQTGYAQGEQRCTDGCAAQMAAHGDVRTASSVHVAGTWSATRRA